VLEVLRFSTDLNWQGAFYVGRAMPQVRAPIRGADGFFGSPIRLASDAPAGRLTTVLAYADWLGSPSAAPVRSRLAELAGYDLVCWCAPKLCHADILVLAANYAPAELVNYTNQLRAQLAELTPPTLFD
jgi:hypothetical protein